jgi:hypothetical protein
MTMSRKDGQAMDKQELDFAQECPRLREDWEVIRRILPDGWEAQAKATRAFVRDDVGFDSAATLLRLLLIHLNDGCSLRETAVRAREGAWWRAMAASCANRARPVRPGACITHST